MNVYKLLYAMRPVDLRSPLGDAHVPPTSQRLADDEEVGRPLALILVVLATETTFLGGHGLSHGGPKLLALLIEAHLREAVIVGAAGRSPGRVPFSARTR